MRFVGVPPGSADPGATSFAACVATITGAALADVPEELAACRQWLAGRGLGLVPIADAQAFFWAGPWIGVRRGDGTAVVMFGVPSGVAWDPLGGGDGVVDAGFVVAPFEVGAAPVRGAAGQGVVRALYIAPEPEVPLEAVTAAEAIAGRGLRGDRYAAGRGTFGRDGGLGHEITLIAAEALAALDEPLDAAEARRNVVCEGVDLDALIGRRFRVGDVVLAGRRRCEPCAHLQRLTRPGVLRALAHRGGLRADILRSGTIRVGDPITEEEA
jgi:MOSC domain-containing protein YiiM